jgi:hypothetical protein
MEAAGASTAVVEAFTAEAADSSREVFHL